MSPCNAESNISDRIQKLVALRTASLDSSTDANQRPDPSVTIPANPAVIGPSRPGKTLDGISESMSSFYNADGLIQLAPGNIDNRSQENCGFDVIAIHGLMGHPRDTWTYKNTKGEVYWLHDFLPKKLPGARIYTYGYDSRVFLSPHTGDIYSYAKKLLDALSRQRDAPSVG